MCYLASQSGATGSGLKLYGLAPDRTGKSGDGRYAKHLRSVLPQQVSAPELNLVEVPVMLRGKRTTKLVPVAPIHEVMEAEVNTYPDKMNDDVEWSSDWAASYFDHPHRVKHNDPREVYPLAVYVDGIKFTRSIGPGRADSLVGVTAYNLRTSRRHLVAVISKRESCGHDTLWPILDNIRWSLEAATEGRRPTERWDGSPWPESSAYFDTQGSQMRSRFLLVQLKADWAEQCSAFGFPTWSSVNSPCFLCSATKATMYNFDDVTLEDTGWGPKHNTYEDECAKHEIRVTIATQSDRDRVLADGGLYTEQTKSKISGRVLKHDIPSLRLLRGDRLEPSLGLPHSGLFDHRDLPFEAVFWRRRVDARGRLLSWVTRRCPLFCPAIGSTPDSVLHLDTLHGVYLGVFSTFTFHVIREILDCDFYQLGGPKDAREPATLERLLND